MELTFLGGAEEIGASCAVLDLEETRLLVDCGQRMNAPPGQALPDFSFLEEGPPIAAVLLTHAHADHIGALAALEPYLNPGCPVFCTKPTLTLAKVMLEDSLRIMAQHRQGEGELPLFPASNVHRALARLTPIPWGKPIRAGEAWATWFPSGHILGAGMIEIHAGGGSIVFSGDVSVADQLSVAGVFVPAIKPQVLVLESTYGSRLHAHRPAQEDRLVDRVADCLDEGGRVLFPTFALGRAQEVLLILGRAMRQGRIPQLPVYADGLVRAVSKVYARFAEDLAPGCRKLWEQGLDPVFPEDLPIRAIRNNEERERIADAGPCVVVASSGMLQGGASQFYARKWIDGARNLILVTGYQDEESPGQALLQLAELPPDQPRYFKLGGVVTEVKCQVESCQLSAHADNGELTAIAAKLQPRSIFLVHGDPAAREFLARTLMASLHVEVLLPTKLETYRLDAEIAAGARSASVRPNPLALWPPWDPHQPRELDLEPIHAWLSGVQPKIAWITLEELAEIWRAPEPVRDVDRAAVREAVYGQPQPYFLPDARRPYILRVNPPENIRLASAQVRRLDVDSTSRVVRELFPSGSGLVRFGFYPEEDAVLLEFRFPKAARRQYLRRMGELRERTGWRAESNDRTRDADLAEILRDWLGEPLAFEVSHDDDAVRVEVPPERLPADAEEVAWRFEQRTGYRLELTSAPVGDAARSPLI